MYSSLDYDIEPELLTLIECVTKSARTLRQNLGIEEEKLRTLNWFRRTFFYEGLAIISALCKHTVVPFVFMWAYIVVASFC